MKIVFATGNKNKLKEINEIFAGSGHEVISMGDAGIDIDIEENGSTFEENSLIKAKAVYEALKEKNNTEDMPGILPDSCIVMADDSGFEVDYLNGEPGVYSARFMGDAAYPEKNAEILRLLKDVPEEKRGARFRTVITAILPSGETLVSKGVLEGRVADVPAGTNGFGYDPIMYLPQYGRTSAELTLHEKNAVGHRGKALEDMKKQLEAKASE